MIKLRCSNVLFFLICQAENVSNLEKVSKPAVLPTSFILSLYLETEKEKSHTGRSSTERSVAKTSPPSLQWKSPPSCHSRARKSSSRGHGKWTGLVGESLTGFFPATGCAPHVPLLHAIYLSALLRLTTGFPW